MDAVVSFVSTYYLVYDGVKSESTMDTGLSASIDFGVDGSVPSDSSKSGRDVGISVSVVSDFGEEGCFLPVFNRTSVLNIVQNL